ncbi:hypothetical protein [Burkholderia gladioli]|uniref:hypothetical protein n=1 Tax=Burkholderia gladioli TaxID=28095 RepID=UPI00163E8AED|nr:hypothetical protein [Burkholderia gladioli]
MKDIQRLPMPWAYVDPAFRACLDEAICEAEFVSNYNRLYGASIGQLPINEAEMKAFVEHVHDAFYMRLPDEAIAGLRCASEVTA